MAKHEDRARCTARTARGTRCENAPLDGQTTCWHHAYKVPGRPSILTDELRDRILDAILDGAYLETAAQAAGVNKTTLYRWIKRGERAEAVAYEQIEDLDEAHNLYDLTDPADWPYIDFGHAVKSTRAHAELELLRMIRYGLGKSPWTAYMTILERSAPARWGRRVEVKHDGAVDLGTPKIHSAGDEDRSKLIEILRAANIPGLDPGEPSPQHHEE